MSRIVPKGPLQRLLRMGARTGLPDGGRSLPPKELARAQIDRTEFTRTFLEFKEQILAVIGRSYLIGIEPEALPVLDAFSERLRVDFDLLLSAGVISASIRDKDPEDILSLHAFRIESWSSMIDRPPTKSELLILDCLTEEIRSAGYTGIRPLSEVPGVTIYYPDGRTAKGGKGRGAAETARRALARIFTKKI